MLKTQIISLVKQPKERLAKMKIKEVRATTKVRLYPSDEQEQLLKQFCGAARWVYNWGLQRWKQR